MNKNFDVEKIKEILFKSYMCTMNYFQSIISFDDYKFSFFEIFKLYIITKIINIINEKFLLLIIINIIMLYAPIENKCEHFLFKGKMAVKQTIEGTLGLLNCFIPKYIEEKKKDKGK